MKCPLCRRRKATVKVNDDCFEEVEICERCRRIYYPTSTEEREDEDQEERRAERNAEFGSVGDYW